MNMQKMSRAWLAVAALIVVALTGCASLSGSAGVPYVVAPSGKGPFPGVIVLHAAGGVSNHVIDFANQLSNEGYVTAVVDYLTAGGVDNIEKGYDLLSKHPSILRGRIGIVGFSMGAAQAFKFTYYSNRFSDRKVSAIVSYYTGADFGYNTEEYPPILFLHGSEDVFTSPQAINLFCEGQKKMGTVCEVKIFEGVKHAFDQVSTEFGGYDAAATSAAWKRTVSFLNTHLKGAQTDNHK